MAEDISSVSFPPLPRDAIRPHDGFMKYGILAILEAKPTQAAAVAALLKSAQQLAREENQTIVWYAFQSGPTTFGIFDGFNDEAGRTAHLQGRIAAALMGKADELLASPPDIRKVDLLAVK
jgi:quinol monooxygenase YgiN